VAAQEPGSLDTWVDWILGGGLTTTILFLLRDRRRIRNMNVKAEKELPLEVRAKAATTFEAELAAITTTFDRDRAYKDQLIANVTADNDRLTHRNEVLVTENDKLVEEVATLKGRLRELMAQVQELVDTVEIMSEKLSQARVQIREDQIDDDFRIYPGPGA
jgi:hypothetical protein